MSEAPKAPYPPKLYAQLHRGTPGDIDFYRRVCAGSARVLELGVGWGRIAGILCADGCEVVGVERDGPMLDYGRGVTQGVDFRAGDMRTVRLGETFDRVILPYNGLYALESDADVVACAETVAAHLTEDGLFVCDVWVADEFHGDDDEDAEDGGDPVEPVGEVRVDGRAYDVFERTVWDRERQRIDATYLHVPRDGARGADAVSGAVTSRYLLSRQITPLLEAGGLEVVVMHGGWDQSVFDEDSERLIVTARRA